MTYHVLFFTFNFMKTKQLETVAKFDSRNTSYLEKRAFMIELENAMLEAREEAERLRDYFAADQELPWQNAQDHG